MRWKRLFYTGVLTGLGVLFSWQGGLQSHNAFTDVDTAIHTETIPLTVVTYNIRGGRDDEGTADAGAIAAELKRLSADIIALQEVDNGLPRSRFADQAKEIAETLGMNYVFAPTINFLVGTYGNALLSRYPIRASSSIELPYHLEPRGLLEAQLEVQGRTLHVFTTHLGLKHSERVQQFEFLYNYLRNKTGVPAILLGDFNTLPADPLLVPIRTLFQDPVFKHQQQLVSINGSHTYGIIDHIFLSPDLQYIHAFSPTTSRSDHYPVTLLLEWQPDNEKPVPY